MNPTAAGHRGRIFTFYSYKGGTGRSMALANLAWLLASARNRVLVIDWDLEAPGLHRYFRPFLIDKDLTGSDGLIDFLIRYVNEAIKPVDAGQTLEASWIEQYADVSRHIAALDVEFPEGGAIDLLGAGRQGPRYATHVTSFDWQRFYDRLGGGAFMEAVKRRLRADYDYVLIDSRTGVSDTAGICTVQMPDSLVVFFTYNNQSIDGAFAVATSAVAERQRLEHRLDPVGPFRVWPVPTRVDQFEEARLKRRQRHAQSLFDRLLDHLPQAERTKYWPKAEIPYVAYLSYEETLAALTDNPDDPKKPLAAMQYVAARLIEPEPLQTSFAFPRDLVARWLPSSRPWKGSRWPSRSRSFPTSSSVLKKCWRDCPPSSRSRRSTGGCEWSACPTPDR